MNPDPDRILDTGPLVALLNRRDAFHAWAEETLAAVRGPFWTCEAVLTEAAHLLNNPKLIAHLVADGTLRIGLRIDEQASGIARLIERYSPRMDLADACVVRMSELYRAARVITLDRRDFSIYRRNGREMIPLIAPD